MESEQLQELQDNLKDFIKNELDKPMIDFKTVLDTVKLLKKVDNDRRVAWNDEKFGAYDKIADEAFNLINSDDIPF